MYEAFVCDAVRTPIGRYAGSLATVRPDDLAAIPIRTLLERNPGLNPSQIEDFLLGCANQAGEDNRNVARMALLLAGLPETVPGASLNRLCGSGMDAVACASRSVKTGEQSLLIAGGIESMSRAPFVIGKATSAFSRQNIMEDTTMAGVSSTPGWRNSVVQIPCLKPQKTLPNNSTFPGKIRITSPTAPSKKHQRRWSREDSLKKS